MPAPDRWDVYSPLGRVVPGTNLIAFKVPLKEAISNRIPACDWFTPSILIQKVKDQGVNLGLVIDLTFTKKYYDPAEITEQEILYKKIYTQGHFVPSDAVYSEFAAAIKEIDKEDHVIGVHCTHGVNRTGYLICRYMIEELKFDPQEAITSFGKARGHELERENYLHDLLGRVPGEITPFTTEKQGEESVHQEKKKERWRNHRDVHPGWRSRKTGPQGNHHPDQQSREDHRQGAWTAHDHNMTGNQSRGFYPEDSGWLVQDRGYHRGRGYSAQSRGTGYQREGNYTKYQYRDTDHRSARLASDHDSGYAARNQDIGYQWEGYLPRQHSGYQGQMRDNNMDHGARHWGRGHRAPNYNPRYDSRNHDPSSSQRNGAYHRSRDHSSGYYDKK